MAKKYAKDNIWLGTTSASKTRNTAEYALALRKKLLAEFNSEASRHTGWENLEKEWRELRSDPTGTLARDEPSNISSPLEMFIDSIGDASYPAPEVLISVQLCFIDYLIARGERSLDECFFGNKHKIKSSTSFTRFKDIRFGVFHREFAAKECRRPQDQNKSLEDMAEQYLESPFFWHEERPDTDSFLRAYRRWLKSSEETDKK